MSTKAQSPLVSKTCMNEHVQSWEDEGGAILRPSLTFVTQLTGTPSQVEWAERIRCSVNLEFDRVAAAFQAVAKKQLDGKRDDTEAIIAILQQKRAEVMGHERAGYFIHEWQEIGSQVREMIGGDTKYLKIKARLKRV